ncbi:MAG TPA: NeuD/PglB/VioB family sugar acetyltransferase [Candidatus Hydrogenedentes bacterium]|nr:NeuD/PglB/VioB family sugar acetyltransferase [Candidatus Hydrogenedentota bacterium]HPG68704.1 NeuD/PglB/VioB family sugar acetyltransferase [Candidatus Hydrogenedentota bacterium]
MSDSWFEVVMPQLGVNDTRVTVVRWLVDAGRHVARGAVLAEVETSKATLELESEYEGYFYPLVDAGAEVAIREVVGLLCPAADPGVLQRYRVSAAAPAATAPGGESRLTTRARALAEEHGIDLRVLPTDRIIRERDVLALVERPGIKVAAPPASCGVGIFGASQGGQAVLECLRAGGAHGVVAFIEDAPERIGTMFAGLPVLSGVDLAALKAEGVEAIVSHIAHPAHRLAVCDRAVKAGLWVINAVHPGAIVASTVRMGVGNVIKAGAVLDAEVVLGDGCIIDNGAIVPHHNRIGSGAHLAPGVCMGGDCRVGEQAILGVGAVIAPRLVIGDGAIIGAGACVVRDVPAGCVVEGAPARVIGKRT